MKILITEKQNVRKEFLLEMKKIGIERIHIEEDTCKSIHTTNNTLLDFNRAGIPLIEIVSKPVIVGPVIAPSTIKSWYT